MDHRGHLRLLACDSGREFCRRVAAELGTIVQGEADGPGHTMVDSQEIFFANWEVKTVLNESLRGADVYVFQLVDDPESERSVNDNLMALITAIDAARQADADRITAVVPQFPYARQERKKAREGITARQVARFLEISGAQNVLTLDLHSEAVAGFFERATLDNLRAEGVLLKAFTESNGLENLVVVSPDIGSADRARSLSRFLGCEIAICDKERDYSKPGVVKSTRLVGEVRGRNVLMVDDMIATGGSILEAAAVCQRAGAASVTLGCTHAFMNGDAVAKLERAWKEGTFTRLLGTDTVIRGEAFRQEHPWFREVTVAPLVAQVVYNLNRRRSVSRLMML